MHSAFYFPDGDRFVATPLTAGPWRADHQHGGPPAALIARAMEALVDGAAGEWQFARFTIDFLRPLEIDVPLQVAAHVSRRGQQILGLEGAILMNDRPLARASALCVRRLAVELPPGTTPADRPRDPDALPVHTFPFFRWDVGYHTAMEGRLDVDGAVWLRPRHPLLADAVVSPLQRVLIAADAINGVGYVLDLTRFSFVNADLSIHLHRLPEGTWVQLAATHTPQPNGVGLVDATLFDVRGSIGRALETQVVAATVARDG
jgi:hypothetical protein